MKSDNEQDKSIKFYEIDGGLLEHLFQKAFEDAQKIGLELGGKCKIALEITVDPPVSEDDDVCILHYAIKRSQPTIKSPNVFAHLDNGVITRTGKTQSDLKQREMGFD